MGVGVYSLSVVRDPGRGARVSSLPDYSTPARRSQRSREFPWNLTCYWCERFQVDPRDIAVILVVPETSDISRSNIMSYLFIEHITKGRELNLFINNIELMIREVPPYLVACFTIWRKIPRDIESASCMCWQWQVILKAPASPVAAYVVILRRRRLWRKRWLFCVLHKIRMVAADGHDAQSLGTDVYCVIVCHWFPRDMSEYTTSVPSDCALTLFGAGTSGTAKLKHISSTLAQSPVIVQWLVYRPGCAPLTALTGGTVCCHLLTASGAPSEDRIAAVMVLCA